MKNKKNLSSENSNITFQQVSKQWLDLCKLRNKKSTFIKYKNLLNTYLLPHIGDMHLQEIDQIVVTSFLKNQFLHGGVNKKGLSSSTIKSLKYVISAVIQYYAKENNLEKIEFHIDFLAPTFSQISILTEAEETLLVNYLLNDLDLFKLGVLICLYTGIRVGELCALSWDDVNLLEGYITINHTVQRLQTGRSTKKTKLYLGMPKSNSSARIIPLPTFLVKIINEVRVLYTKAIFVISGSDKVVDPRTMQYKFSQYQKDLNINTIKFHSLRHSFATRCVRIGFDIKTLSEILGHSNVQITLNRYVHSSIEMKRKQMQLLGEEWIDKMNRNS